MKKNACFYPANHLSPDGGVTSAAGGASFEKNRAPPTGGRRRCLSAAVRSAWLPADDDVQGGETGPSVDAASASGRTGRQQLRSPPPSFLESAARTRRRLGRARASWRRGGCQASAARVRLLFYLVRRSPSGNLFVGQKKREEKSLMCECACVAAHRPRPSGPPPLKWPPPAGGRSLARRRRGQRRWWSELMRADNERRGGGG